MYEQTIYINPSLGAWQDNAYFLGSFPRPPLSYMASVSLLTRMLTSAQTAEIYGQGVPLLIPTGS